MLIIEIKFSECKHIADISYYNNNYYLLPFSVCGYSVAYNYYDGCEDFCGNSVGYIDENGEYIPKLYLHTTDAGEKFIFNGQGISEINRWT